MSIARTSLLHEILSQPTAPFREGHVLRLLLKVLEDAGVPHFQDPVGNLVVGARNQAAVRKLVRQKSTEPVRVFIAHLDHPGFHGTRWRSATELEVKWHGGTPVAHLEGAPVWLADSADFRAEAALTESKLLEHGKALDTSVVRFSAPQDKRRKPETLFGAFRFRAPVWQEGELLYTKAADDLVGAFSIVDLALNLLSRPRKGKGKNTGSKAAPFLGLLSRAEEVGFIGAIGHFELGWYRNARRPVFCVSLETSRTLPGAEIGKGPVVRLGDRTTVFTAGHTHLFSQLAQKALPDQHQKRIMDGGSCEGTAATSYGFATVAISVPLGNYHNQSFQGGPDSRGDLGPAPEFVHVSDIEGMMTLCRGLLTPKLPWADPWKEQRARFKKSLRGYAQLLRSGP